MTDGELKKKAEEYSNWLYHSKAWNSGEDMLVKAYLAGAKEMLKENGVVWHDLRKNPNDLPKERGGYLVAIKLLKGWDTTILMYNNDEDEDELCWLDSEYTNYNDDVIAWCEIPKFEVKE
jgi:hypothetical protein